jgi:hypothetical protein
MKLAAGIRLAQQAMANLQIESATRVLDEEGRAELRRRREAVQQVLDSGVPAPINGEREHD